MLEFINVYNTIFALKYFLLIAVLTVCLSTINGLGMKGRPCNRLRNCDSVLNGPRLACNIWSKEEGER